LKIKSDAFCIDRSKPSREKDTALSKEEFIILIRENKISLYRIAKGILGNEQDVEDAISESILKAFKNLSHLKKTESFKPWIIKIMVNECYSIINKKSRIDLKDNFEAYGRFYEKEDKKELMYAINTLDKDFKAIIILFYYEDMSIKDISKTLNIPQGTVKSRLSRAKDKLKVILESDYRRDNIG